MRPWIVWATGLLAYIVAVFDRTTLGVSGLAAAERFSAGPTVLSMFVVLQVVVYACAQVPAGLLLDRYGSRVLIVSGATLMASGQLALAFTESLPAAVAARAVVGLGDAVTFISVLRLVPHWFAPRQIPVVTQLTGIVGQLGQVLSAVPFLAILSAAGWSVAYASAAAFGALSLVLILLIVKNTPDGSAATAEAMSVRETLTSVKTVWLRPGTRLGFFTHMGTQFSITIFALMWGLPYLTVAQGLSAGAAGALLSLSVATAIASGILIGVFTGRYPHRRSWIVLGIIGSNALVWTVVLSLSGPAPLWLLVVLVAVISVGGPGSMVGFDFARTFNTRATLGTAQGMVNMGGFLVSLILMQAMGMVMEAQGGISFDSFRQAWTLQYAVWALAVLGILVTRRKARRQLEKDDRFLLEDIKT
ncbi:MFS transporter [Mycolicibacterium parafortuitum]|uniref:MFS family transporter [Rhodococcus jostii RHA1] n=1 Tax=Mycolicibacterium parafortuitum TaxID=39692 RepID=A0A375YPW6_MYCPF|nr:MFS transporter [Mycolicibacterium parafortuitum]ORB29688.1 MFS transporter [Mycolicibacterium parafortuitum]SRX83123.1 MFS family transporter [Rhodococcus jostii RHA1] [Mycolicibacterium parafortuitum]